MDTATHYDVLGVPYDATHQVIVEAYHRALHKLRELLEGGAPDHDRLDAVYLAYRTLTNPHARSAYDATLPGAGDVTIEVPVAAEHSEENSRRLQFSFAGSGGEYFRVWIVNLLLSIVTLGIYSAWAKVRREQYFHRNLILDGSGFDYLATPKAVLKGRAIAFVLLMIYSATKDMGPTIHSLAGLVLGLTSPWFILRSLRFRAHNTTYRGLRFSFHGTFRQAFVTYVGFGFLTLITVGLAFPMFLQRQKKFLFDNLRYGLAPLHCSLESPVLFGIFLRPILALIGVGIVGALLAAFAKPLLPMLIVATLFSAQFLLLPYLHVRTTNAVWSRVTLGQEGKSRFVSEMGVGRYFAITLKNLLMLIVTLGFYWPWMKVRLASYRAECLSLHCSQSLDDFFAGEATHANAVGDEMAEMFDMDIAL